MGHPLDPDYWREWRARHPAYRERQKSLRRARRVAMTPDQRRRDRGRAPAPSPAALPIPSLWSDPHPLILRAWEIVGRRPHGTVLSFREDEILLDCVGVAVLAQLEDRCPVEAVRRFRATETNWLTRAAPWLLDDGWVDA